MMHEDGPNDSICMYMHVYACIIPVLVSKLGHVAAKAPRNCTVAGTSSTRAQGDT